MTNKNKTDYQLGGKLPPHSNDAEIYILGSCMMDKGAIEKAMSFLNENDFYNDKHKKIYNAIIDLYNADLQVDLVILAEYMNKIGQLESVGGAYNLSDINSKTPTASNQEHFCKIVKEKSLKRKVIQQAGELLSSAYDDTTDAFELVSEYQSKSIDLTKNLFTGILASTLFHSLMKC